MINIGNIGNYYGGLAVKESDGKYFWGIMDYDDEYNWEEIPETLYIELVKFGDQCCD